MPPVRKPAVEGSGTGAGSILQPPDVNIGAAMGREHCVRASDCDEAGVRELYISRSGS